MSSQKSALPIHPSKTEKSSSVQHNNGEAKVSLDTDPFAAPNVYYGTSHSPRKVAKSRTYSAVSHAQKPTIHKPISKETVNGSSEFTDSMQHRSMPPVTR